jgi:hypothetical protein
MRFPLVTIPGLCILCAGAVLAQGSSRLSVIGIDRQGFRLGQLVWKWQARNRAVTLADFTRTFGRPSSCRVGNSGADAHVVWRRPGIRGEFTTLGGFPRTGDNACTAPASVHPDTVEVVGRFWRTSRGLQVGATLRRLQALYPKASRHRDGWWLVTRRKDPLFGTYGQLVVGVRSGRVSYLRLVLHEEGD